MKRWIVASQIVIAALFVVKILFHAEAFEITSLASILSLAENGQAIAQTTGKPAVAAAAAAIPTGDILDDGLQKERELFALLQKRQKELDARESSVKTEEQKVTDLKKEIVEKIDALKALETQLSAHIEEEKSGEAKRLKELAKVYEATPPQKAAAMLEKLAVKTAAGITINMKRERAGLIWGHLDPQKAVEITNEITKTARLALE